MKANLKLVENIAENILNENWSALHDDICLISPRNGTWRKILAALIEDDDNEWYPASEEDERWLKSIAPMLAGEYAVGNL